MRTFNYTKINEQKWDSEVLSLIAAIYKEAGKQELYLKQRPEKLERLVEIAKVQSTESSNAIEGIVTTSTRIKQIMEDKTTPRNRDEQEIAGYRDVLNVIHENFDVISITPNYILQLHKMLYGHMNNPAAGRTKSVQNYISATYPNGTTRILFTPLSPFETPSALESICNEFNRVIGNNELEPLIAIPVFIHDFLCIHPFNDGNGRMSRLLTTLLLYQSGFHVGKYISLEAKIAKNKDLYYDALNQSQIGLNTRYRQFYDYYIKQDSKCEIIRQFKEDLSEHIEDWADLEIALGNYAEHFSPEQVNDYIELLDDVQDALANYIDDQLIDFNVSDEDRKKLITDLFSPERYLNPREKEGFDEYKKLFLSHSYNADVISFNYTKTFEKLYDYTGTSVTLNTRSYNRSSYSQILKSVEHIHGLTNSDMILGVNDSSQIKNDALKNIQEVHRALVKTEANINAGTLRDRRAQKLINTSDILCIYGMSIGATDKIWWETIINHLNGSAARLIIFSKGDEIIARRSYRARSIKDSIIQKLLSYKKLDENVYKNIASRIFVCINSKMFSLSSIAK